MGGAFWASCGSLGASQNPSALCIKSGWAGASVALKIRSEYLKKEALLLLGGPGGPRGALRKPKKFRLGSLAASSGRRTDPLHIHSGSWPPGPQTLSFSGFWGRVRITRKTGVASVWALLGPSTDLAWGPFFVRRASRDIFWGCRLRVSWASCGSLAASQNPLALCIKSGWAGASVALKPPPRASKKKCKNGFGLKRLFRRSALCSLDAACGHKII